MLKGGKGIGLVEPKTKTDTIGDVGVVGGCVEVPQPLTTAEVVVVGVITEGAIKTKDHQCKTTVMVIITTEGVGGEVAMLPEVE